MYRNVVTAMSPDRNAPWPKRHRPKSPVPTGRILQSVATIAAFCGFHFWFFSSFFTTDQLKQDCSNVKYNGRTKETSSWTLFFYAKNFNRLKLSSSCNATINPFSHRFTQCEQVYLTITRKGNELETCSNPLKKRNVLQFLVKETWEDSHLSLVMGDVNIGVGLGVLWRRHLVLGSNPKKQFFVCLMQKTTRRTSASLEPLIDFLTCLNFWTMSEKVTEGLESDGYFPSFFNWKKQILPLVVGVLGAIKSNKIKLC